MSEHPGNDRRRFTVLVNPKIREEQRRQAALRKFIKDCERLYEKNRAHLQGVNKEMEISSLPRTALSRARAAGTLPGPMWLLPSPAGSTSMMCWLGS